MKYSLNEYLPYLSDNCARVLVYTNSEQAAKVVTEYNSFKLKTVNLNDIIPNSCKGIPSPTTILQIILQHTEENECSQLVYGLDAYLSLLHDTELRDFFIGIRNLLDEQGINVHFMISKKYFNYACFSNPKYEGAMYIITLQGEVDDNDLSITIIPQKWAPNNIPSNSTNAILSCLGEFIPNGDYVCAFDDYDIPSFSYGDVAVISSARDTLQQLYKINVNYSEELLDYLLQECKKQEQTPVQLLTNRFGGAEQFTLYKAPIKLAELNEDPLWEMYVWLLKQRIAPNTYLSDCIESDNLDASSFVERYIVDTAVALSSCECKEINKYADERATVIKKWNSFEPLIEKFVNTAESLQNSIYFMNCGTNAEMKGLIRCASAYSMTNLPSAFKEIAPAIYYYLSPYYDYSNEVLTDYFTKLRRFRINNSVDEDFVKLAYSISVPQEIKTRDSIICSYDDGETALLVVDGLSAEYYPLLINMAKHNHLKIQEHFIVSANLPTSTGFNKTSWSQGNELPPIKRVDNISHEGISKYEKVGYEDNLAELLILFEKTILTRVSAGLRSHKRVVVTGDHGASYLAINAYKAGLSRTIPWDNPDDWRYTSLPTMKEGNDDLVVVYHPDTGLTYYVVKGYNRFSKSGSKQYALHGGATLEEVLIPFVVFTNDSKQQINENIVTEEQFEENDDFDI